MESVGKPWSRIDIEIPSDGICAILIQCIERIYSIAFTLAHLLSVLILDMAKNDYVLVWSLVKQKCRLCHK